MTIIEPPTTRRETLRPILFAVAGCAFVATAFLSSGATPSKSISDYIPASLTASIPVLVPDLEYDATWPKPLPDNWVMGAASAMCVDPSDDSIWVMHRHREVTYCLTPEGQAVSALGTTGMCVIACETECGDSAWVAAPPIMVFNAAGDLLKTLDPSTNAEGDWPLNPHFIHVGDDGFLYIGGGLPTPHEYEHPIEKTHDTFILKLDKTGAFVAQFGTPFAGTGTDDPSNFNRPGLAVYEPKENELYVADGHGYVRVAVLDATSGVLKRQWGGYGNPPDIALPTEQRYGRTVHAVEIANDGMVYVCDRDRGLLHVHEMDGTFLQEVSIPEYLKQSMGPEYMNTGALAGFPGPWAVAFSPDAAQTYLYVTTPDQMLLCIKRETMTLLATYGAPGVTPGSFNGMHAVQTNTAGDVFISEIAHGRVTKLTNKGTSLKPRYKNIAVTTGTPTTRPGPLFTINLPFFQVLLHMGCAKSPDPEVPTCSMDSWAW